MAIEHIHLSQQAKEQLSRLKRTTGIGAWNILCRWALCVSLAEPSIPPRKRIPADSNVEMSWRVFGGRLGDVYLAVVKERCIRDGLETDDETVTEQLRLHLHRGVAYLASDRSIREVGDFIALARAA